MCDSVIIDGRDLWTVKELCDALGIAPVKNPVYSSPPEDTDCLCSVDLPTMLRKAGLQWREEFGEFIVTKDAGE